MGPMTVPSTYLLDLLAGRKQSSFVLLADSDTCDAKSCLWPCLYKATCDMFKYLIVRSEVFGLQSPGLPSTLEQSAKVVNSSTFANASACLDAVEMEVSRPADDGGKRYWVVVFDNLDNFLLDGYDGGGGCQMRDWIYQLAARLAVISTTRHVASLICGIKLYSESFGLTAGSECLLDVFKSVATTFLGFQTITRENDRVCLLSADFWHRRTKDAVLKSAKQPTALPTNKPALSDRCEICLNLESLAVLHCRPTVDRGLGKEDDPGLESQPVLPSSTFRLSLTPAEAADRQKVVLPFKANANTGPSNDECRIDYEPDVYDDFDDEDPDDDLDI
nr:unnamed protein product [Spirometra erinaceieuropaei]